MREQGFGERESKPVVGAYRMAGLRDGRASHLHEAYTTSSRPAAIRRVFRSKTRWRRRPLADTMCAVTPLHRRFDHEADGRIRIARRRPIRCADSDDLLADVVRVAERYDTPCICISWKPRSRRRSRKTLRPQHGRHLDRMALTDGCRPPHHLAR